MNECVNLRELEQLARARLPQMAWDYYASGADDERCLTKNCAAFEQVELFYRVMVDVSKRDPKTTVLGHDIALPVITAPTAFHRLAHDHGELATVRGTGDAGSIFILSTLSNTAVEEVCAAATGPVWFQLYVYRDRAATEGLVRRVEAAGCKALVLTVDAPLLGRRERDVKNRFALPGDLAVQNMFERGRVATSGMESGLAAYFAEQLDPSLTWDAVAWLKSITALPVLVKGVIRADDARRAIQAGAAGVVVSNHGGRQLDAAPATITALPRIADAIGGDGTILLDGGVRRGADVIKAIASGAHAVLIGRPILWGLAAGGREGVAHAYGMLRRELELAMALCGTPDVASMTRDLVMSDSIR